MADLSNILADGPMPDEVYDTSDILRRTRQTSPLSQGVRSLADLLVRDSNEHNVFVPWLNSVANGLDRSLDIGKDTAVGVGTGLMGSAAYGPFALRAAAPAMRGAHEWPVSAAIKANGETFTGPNHYAAMMKAEEKFGPGIWEAASKKQIASGAADDGFITNAGRYVSREEAGQMLDATNQTRHYQTLFGNPKQGKNGLLSEALELYDPKTGREAAAPMGRAPDNALAEPRAAGFDTAKTYYHGTTKDFDTPRMPFYVTDNPDMASLFAKASDPIIARAIEQPSGGRVLPVHINRDGFADLTSKADFERVARALVEQVPRYDRGDGRGIRSLTLEEARAQLADSIRDGRASFAVPPVIDAMRRAGFNGADVWEAWNKFGLGQPDSSTVVFNPQNVRPKYGD